MSELDVIHVPYSAEAEQSVLGGLLLDNEAFDRISDLEPWHFFSSANREIFTAIAGMIAHGKPADVVTVTEELGDKSAETGGIMYLGQLQMNTPSAANIRRYADIVKDKAMLRGLLAASNTIAGIANDGEGDVSSKINRAQAEVMKLSETARKSDPLPIREVLRGTVEAIERRASKQIDGHMTGMRDLDDKLNGLKRGDLVIVAARPAMGKSTLAVQIAHNIAQTGEPGLILSQEMSYQQLSDRLIASSGRVSMKAITTGNLDDEGWNRVAAGIGKLHELPLFLDDQAALTIADVCSKARMTKRRHGLGILVVDYLQLMAGSGKHSNRNGEIEEISRGLKSLAKELAIPVVALSQLSRECEKRPNKRPVMSDLRDSGSIEQDADVIVFIYRDEIYNHDTMEKGTAEILIAKNRQGETGMVRMAFRGEFSRFDDLSHDYQPPQAPTKRYSRGNDDL